MKKSKINNENYILIQGWMIKELNLKGNDLLIFAIIYGFSQDNQSKYKAGLQYLADWTGSTKQGCIKNLKNLLDKELIIKEEFELNNIKYCNYSINMKKVYTIKQSLTPIKQSLINNIDNNINNKLDNKLSNSQVEKISKSDSLLKENIKCIIDYLNDSIGSKYKYDTKGTIKDIKARFKEGYTLDDFYDVIDKKVSEWINTEMEQYLRPSTLFGNKFENYLNQKTYFKGTPKTSYSSKPSFDNTANHNIQIFHMTDEEFNKLTHEEKIDVLLNKFSAVADMTINQKEFYNQYCVVHDWED